MRIAFDTTAFAHENFKNRGIGNYVRSLVDECLQADKENQYYFFSLMGHAMDEDYRKRYSVKEYVLFSGKNHYLLTAERYQEVIRAYLQHFLIENAIDVFVVGLPFCRASLPYDKNWFGDVGVVAIAYDIIPFLFQQRYFGGDMNKNGQWYINSLNRLKEMDLILAISDATREDLIKYCDFKPEKIKTIWAGYGREYHPIIHVDNETTPLKKYGITDAYFLCTGGDDDRKNIERLILAYAQMKPTHRQKVQLVVACKLSDSSYRKYNQMIRDLGMTGRVVLTGFVPTEDLVVLYTRALGEVFVSEYEGFGLPIVEAWACGTRVVTSNTSSMKEIGGDAAILVDPYSVESICKGMKQCIDEEELGVKRDAGQQLEKYTWSAVAKRFLTYISELSEKKKDRKKSKLAVFTPLPPQLSGISDYAKILIDEMSQYRAIDVFIDDGYDNEYEFKKGEVQVFPHTKFAEKSKEYGLILYEAGGSPCHTYMLPYMDQYPGCVELHDYNMSGMIEPLLVNRETHDDFIKKAAVDFGRVDAERYFIARISQRDPNLKMQVQPNGFAVKNATSVIVHNEYMRERLLERNIGLNVHKVRLYSEFIEPVENKNDPDGQKRAESFTIGVFGIVSETKRILQIVRAVTQLIDEKNNIRLFIVGKYDEAAPYYAQCREMADRHKDRIRFLGRVDEEEMQSDMREYDIILNLRHPYQGESSGVFARLFGLGKPVVVNKVGDFDEVPDDVCYKIPAASSMSEEQEIKKIKEAIVRLYQDDLREELGKKAYEYAKENLSVSSAAKKVLQVMESKSWRGIDNHTLNWIYQNVVSQGEIGESDIQKLKDTILYGLPSMADRKTGRILFDMTISHVWIKESAVMGISRVCLELFKALKSLADVEIVTVKDISGECGLYHIDQETFEETGEAVIPNEGDIFLMPELQLKGIQVSSNHPSANFLSDYGVRRVALVYDILPITIPECFQAPTVEKMPGYIYELVENYDAIICDSHTVSRELAKYADESNYIFHNAVDIFTVYPGMTELNVLDGEADARLKSAVKNDNSIYLMVGTIEPRKGYEYVLDTFEALWDEGYDMMLCIIGSIGWKMQHFVERMKSHPEFNEKIIFLESANNATLAFAYQNATALIQASIGEGYGLPIVEAERYGLPVICSDIPVFREVAGESAVYFDRSNKAGLQEKMKEIILGHISLPKTDGIPFHSWEQCAKDLLECLEGKKSCEYQIRRTTLQKYDTGRIGVSLTFPFYPPRGGGQSRIFGLYKNIAKHLDVEIISLAMGNTYEQVQMVAPHLIQHSIPKSQAHFELEREMENSAEIPVTDIAMMYAWTKTPAYGNAIREVADRVDYMVVSHPYTYEVVAKYVEPERIIYEAQDVEFTLKKEMLPGNKKTEEILERLWEVEKACCTNSRYILVCSKADAKEIQQLYGVDENKIIIVPNGVDCEEVSYRKNGASIRPCKKTGIFIGSWHGPNIEAVEQVIWIAERCEDTLFQVVGSAGLYFKERKLPSNVELLGVLSEHEMDDAFDRADFALNPMLTGSGTNLKIFEYMARGIPVITTVFGSRGIDDKSCLFISAVEDMPEAISTFQAENYRRMTKKARRYVESYYDWEVIANRFLDAIKDR